jgi:hypothetical protein
MPRTSLTLPLQARAVCRDVMSDVEVSRTTTSHARSVGAGAIVCAKLDLVARFARSSLLCRDLA